MGRSKNKRKGKGNNQTEEFKQGKENNQAIGKQQVKGNYQPKKNKKGKKNRKRKRKTLRSMLKKVISPPSQVFKVIGITFFLLAQAFIIVQSQIVLDISKDYGLLGSRFEIDTPSSSELFDEENIENTLEQIQPLAPNSRYMYGMQLLHINYNLNSTCVGQREPHRKTCLFYHNLKDIINLLIEKKDIRVEGTIPYNDGEIMVDRMSYYEIQQIRFNGTENFIGNFTEQPGLDLPLSLDTTFELRSFGNSYNFTRNLTITGVIDYSMDSTYINEMLQFKKEIKHYYEGEHFSGWSTSQIQFKIDKEKNRIFLGNLETGKKFYEQISSNFNTHKIGMKLNIFKNVSRSPGRTQALQTLKNSTFQKIYQALKAQQPYSNWELANDPLQPLGQEIEKMNRYLWNIYMVLIVSLIGVLLITDWFRSKVYKEDIENKLDKLYSKGITEHRLKSRVLTSVLVKLNKILFLTFSVNFGLQSAIYGFLEIKSPKTLFGFSLEIQLVFIGLLNISYALMYRFRYNRIFNTIKEEYSTNYWENSLTSEKDGEINDMNKYIPLSKTRKIVKNLIYFIIISFSLFVLSLAVFLPLRTLQENKNFFPYESVYNDFVVISNWHQIVGFLPFFIYPALFIFPYLLWKVTKKITIWVAEKRKNEHGPTTFDAVFSKLFHTSHKFRKRYLLAFMILISISLSFNNLAASNRQYDQERSRAAFGPNLKCVKRDFGVFSNVSSAQKGIFKEKMADIGEIQNVTEITTNIDVYYDFEEDSDSIWRFVVNGASLDPLGYLSTIEKDQIIFMNTAKSADSGDNGDNGDSDRTYIEQSFGRLAQNSSYILLSSKYALQKDIKIGEKIPLTFYRNETDNTIKTFEVVGIVDYLPGIDLSENLIIFNRELSLLDEEKYKRDNYRKTVFIKVKQGTNIKNLRTKIVENYMMEFLSVKSYEYQKEDDLYFLEIINYLSWILIAIFGIIQISLFTIEMESFREKTEKMHLYGYSKHKTRKRILKTLLRENSLYLVITLAYSVFLTYYMYKYQAIQFLFQVNYINPLNGIFGSFRGGSDSSISASFPYAFVLEPVFFIIIGMVCGYFLGYFFWFYLNHVKNIKRRKD